MPICYLPFLPPSLPSLLFPFLPLFLFLITLAHVSSSVLNRSAESEYLSPHPLVCGEEALRLSPLNIMVVVGFHRCFYLKPDWGNPCLILVCWEFLSWMNISFGQMHFLLFCSNIFWDDHMISILLIW